MDFVITKASDYEWVEFQHFESIEDILKFKEKQQRDIIITDSFDYQLSPEEIMERWNNVDFETAKRISETPHQILIYDSYIE